MRRQLQQSLPRHEKNVVYLTTTECRKIFYPTEKQNSTRSAMGTKKPLVIDFIHQNN